MRMIEAGFAGRRLLAAASLVSRAAQARRSPGTVTYDRQGPDAEAARDGRRPACAKKHTKPVPSEVLVLGAGNTMANIMVRVEERASGRQDATRRRRRRWCMDQNGCQYKPHVMGIMVGQPFKILNSDGLLHNVHALPKVERARSTWRCRRRARKPTTNFARQRACS